MCNDNLKNESGHIYTSIIHTPIVCTDCGKDTFATLITSSDGNPRCSKCNDKFMMVNDIPKCVGCGEPVPFGHLVENQIHCDICYHNLLLNKVNNQIDSLPTDSLPTNKTESAWDDFENFSSFDHDRTDYPWEVRSAVYDTTLGLVNEANNKLNAKTPNDIGPTHMTHDRMKILQDLQQSQPTRLNRDQRELMEHRGYITENEINLMRNKVLNYDFTGGNKSVKIKKPKNTVKIKKSKDRKPIGDTKFGGWLSKFVTNIKEGWAEMMEEPKEIIDVDDKIDTPSIELKVDVVKDTNELTNETHNKKES